MVTHLTSFPRSSLLKGGTRAPSGNLARTLSHVARDEAVAPC